MHNGGDSHCDNRNDINIWNRKETQTFDNILGHTSYLMWKSIDNVIYLHDIAHLQALKNRIKHKIREGLTKLVEFSTKGEG